MNKIGFLGQGKRENKNAVFDPLVNLVTSSGKRTEQMQGFCDHRFTSQQGYP